MNRSSEQKLQNTANSIAERARNLLESTYGMRSDLSFTWEESFRLAHYTSLEAIVSMLQASGGGLRLSDSDTMNDPDEGRATRDGRVISDLLNNEFGRESWIWRRYSSAHLCCLIGIDQKENKDIEVGDDLLFWRLYGNECRGVSVTMPSHLANKLVESLVVQRVVYTKEPDMQVNVAAISKLLEDLDDLRSRARKIDLWPKVCQAVIPACDLLLGQRFLLKRSHYEMEKEYRAVAFVTQGDDNAPEDSRRFMSRGWHVRFGRIRTYVQIPQLSCESILTTSSQITIGSGIPDPEVAKNTVKNLLEKLDKGMVLTRVSEIRYRSD